MAGLGFANPELKKAQMLARLNGSTAIPQGAVGMGPQAAGMAPPPPSSVAPLPMPPMRPGGMGQTPSPQEVQPLPLPPELGIGRGGPAGVAQGTAPSAPPPEVPDAGEDGPGWQQIAGAIGHVLLSIDAGYHGRAMPEGPEAEMRAQQDQEMQVNEFIVNTVARGWEASRNAPSEKREEILKLYEQAIKNVAPEFDFRGFVEGLESDADRVDRLAPDIATLSPEAKELFMARIRSRGGDQATAASDAVRDPDFMKELQEFDDRRNAPVLKFKLLRVKAAMQSLGMPEDAFADLTIEDLRRLNEQLPEKARLTPSELATLSRNPVMGSIIGMKPARPQSGTLDGNAGYSGKPPVGARRPAEEDGTEAPPPSPRPAPRKAAAPAPQKAPQGPSAKPKAAAYYPPGLKNPALPGTKPAAKPAGKPTVKPTVKPKAPVKMEMPAGLPGPKKAAAPAETAKRERRIVVKADTEIPNFGKVKKGEALIYDYKTGQYRRAK